jgi:CRISPR system Cascade subunit CasA
MGISEVFLKASGIREIADPIPLVTAAIHRLLIAILHRSLWPERAYGPATAEEWLGIWNQGLWDTAAVQTYLARWRDRFDLFSEHHPFYQVASLDLNRGDFVAQLRFHTKGNALLFDHSTKQDASPVTPAQATRLVLGYQSFDFGGTKTAEHGQKSANAALLNRSAVAIVRGTNLFQTLMLNLHKYNREDEEPFPSRHDDSPAWERDQETRPMERRPNGYLDILTWQSRRIRVQPDLDGDGNWVVRRAVAMKGYQLPKGVYHHSYETMSAFRKREKAQANQEPWPPVGFTKDRALWRDSLAILQSVGEQRERPKTVTWLHDLVSIGAIERSSTFGMDFFGISTNQARVEFWRHERLPLPLAYLEDNDLVGKLGDCLKTAEDIRNALVGSIYLLACQLLFSEKPEKALSKKSKDHAREKVNKSLNPEAAYWPALEGPFKRFMVDLADQRPPYDPDAEDAKPLPAQQEWAGQVEKAARNAFATATSGLDTSARTLKALALAERAFSTRLHRILKATTETTEAEGGNSDSTANAK